MSRTPAQRWKAEIAAQKIKCRKIASLAASIRYVGVINEFGRTLTGVIRPDTKPLMSSEQIKHELFIISNLMTLRKHSTGGIGPLDHAVLRHKKVTLIVLQKKYTYYTSVDAASKQIPALVKKIKDII